MPAPTLRNSVPTERLAEREDEATVAIGVHETTGGLPEQWTTPLASQAVPPAKTTPLLTSGDTSPSGRPVPESSGRQVFGAGRSRRPPSGHGAGVMTPKPRPYKPPMTALVGLLQATTTYSPGSWLSA